MTISALTVGLFLAGVYLTIVGLISLAALRINSKFVALIALLSGVLLIIGILVDNSIVIN